MNLRTIAELGDLKGKVVLLRSSLNVPIQADGTVRDQFRLERAVPTMQYLREAGAVVVVIGHIGRAEDETLEPVYQALQTHLDLEWCSVWPDDPDVFRQKAPSTVVLLENLRQYKGETTNDPALAQQLARYADYYVNDAFANAHRSHTSMVGIPAVLPSYAGTQLEAEIAALDAARTPNHPALFILGGAKFETKLGLVEEYLARYDTVFVGGALAHDVMRARGLEVGRSLVSDISLADAAFVYDERLLVPNDVVVRRADDSTATVLATEVEATDIILDCGPATIALLRPTIEAATTILWNGPLGNYEAGFQAGTEALARAIADSPAQSYVGGGDTVAAIQAINRNDDFTFISTGGGAMLRYLEAGTLPALELLCSR